MLEPLKRYGINPKTRSRDGYAVKLHPLTSCDPQAIADALAHSTLRGPQADTLLLVDIPSTRGSHTWTLTCNGLLGTYTAPIPPFHFHSAWQDPAQWTNPERHRSSSAPAQPTYFSTSAPTVRDDILNVQADGRLAAHLRETPAPHILEEDAELNEDLTGNDFTYSHDTTTAFQELLAKIDSNTKEPPNVLSTKHYAALTQLPLTYPWARLVLDLEELLICFDRHLITCLIANHVQGNATPHPGAPRIYDSKDLELPGNSELTIHQFEALLIAKQAEDDKELDVAATACRRMKRAKQTLARLPHPAASSTITSAPLAPAPLGNTPPPSPRIPDSGRSRIPPPERPRPIGMHPGPPLTAARPISPSAHSICRL
eukprot:symbB.v1.2.033674.t1/scaffold4216.1/size42974/5